MNQSRIDQTGSNQSRIKRSNIKRNLLSKCVWTGVLTIFMLVSMTAGVQAQTETYDGIPAGEIREEDFFSATPILVHDGEVRGDVIVASQKLSVNGKVYGDVLGYALELGIAGSVDGNVRVFSNTAFLTGSIARNVMIYSPVVSMGKDSLVGGQVYLIGDTIELLGRIGGNAVVQGQNVTLGGYFAKDVTINGEMLDGAGGASAQITILPGTEIAGTLTFRGEQEPEIPADAKIGKVNFIRISDTVAAKPMISVKALVKDLLTAVVLFVFALLLYRLFPRFFVRQAGYIRTSPLQTAGIGIASLGSIVGGAILLVILGILSVLVFNLSVIGFAITLFTAFIVISGSLTAIPVSLWLGKALLGEAKSVPASLAAGLSVLTLVRILLGFAIAFPSFGWIGVISWMLQLAIWLFGMGAILRTLADFIKSANRHAEIQEQQTDMM